MIPSQQAASFGPPKLDDPVRFAVGDPQALTSNSWRIWRKGSDLYLACRDNFKETKVSLHASGRWRMGFTEEAVTQQPGLLQPGQNRAWDVWTEPAATLPDTVTAFKLVFVTSELAVRPEQRHGRLWRDVIFINAGPHGFMTVATLFITLGTPALQQEGGGPCPRWGLFDIGNGRFAQLIAHWEPESTFRPTLEQFRNVARVKSQASGNSTAAHSYAYFLGKQQDGCRYLFGARVGATTH